MAEEKKTRKVEEFTDTYGIIRRYQTTMGFECEGFDPLRAYGPHNPFKEGTTYYGLDDYSSSSDDDDEAKKNKKTTEKPPFDTTDLIKYITQVRNSFGFDVDVIIPPWLMNLCMLYLIPIDASRPSHHNFVHKAAKTAIDEINVDMKSKSYELVEVAKVVTSLNPYFLTFLTLAVKNVEEAEAATTTTIQAIVHHPRLKPWELHQWRFKPDAAKA